MEKLEFGRLLKTTLMGEARCGRGHFRVADGSIHVIDVFIKSFDKRCVAAGKTRDGVSVRENPRTELRIQAKLSNANCGYIVRLLDVKDGGDEILAVMEFCSGGELFSIIQSAGPAFTHVHAKTYFIQLMLGIQAIHSMGVAIRDLSAENLVLTKESNLRICDFGLAIELQPGDLIREESAIGKIKYIPPELFSAIPYDPFKGDLWSACVILFVMLFRVFPWNLPHASDPLFVLICSGKLNDVMRAWNQPAVDPLLLDLFSKIFCPEELRIGVKEILEHQFLREVWENNPSHVEASQRAAKIADENQPLPLVESENNIMRGIDMPSVSTISAAHNSAVSSSASPSLSSSLFPDPNSTLIIESIPNPTPLFTPTNTIANDGKLN